MLISCRAARCDSVGLWVSRCSNSSSAVSLSKELAEDDLFGDAVRYRAELHREVPQARVNPLSLREPIDAMRLRTTTQPMIWFRSGAVRGARCNGQHTGSVRGFRSDRVDTAKTSKSMKVVHRRMSVSAMRCAKRFRNVSELGVSITTKSCASDLAQAVGQLTEFVALGIGDDIAFAGGTWKWRAPSGTRIARAQRRRFSTYRASASWRPSRSTATLPGLEQADDMHRRRRLPEPPFSFRRR